MSNIREIDIIEMLEKRHNFSRKDSKMLTEFLQDKSATKEDLKVTEIKLEAKIDGVKKDLEAKIDKEITEVKTDLAWIKMLGGGLVIGVLVQIIISLFT